MREQCFGRDCFGGIRMSRRAILRTTILVGLATLVFGAGAPAFGQVVLTPAQQVENDFFAFFYRNPQLEALPAHISRMQETHPGWEAYPPFAGLLAVVFKNDGGMIEKVMPDRLTPKMADTMAAAIRLSGRENVPQSVRDRLAKAGSDPVLSAQFANLPRRLADLRIVTPTHLDILWGAFFASGSSEYVRMILDFFAAMANRSEAIAIDITKVAISMSGGPKTILGELRGKYENDLGFAIIVAAMAEWALWSNARQHPEVNAVVTAYIAEHPTSFATRSLKVGMRNR